MFVIILDMFEFISNTFSVWECLGRDKQVQDCGKSDIFKVFTNVLVAKQLYNSLCLSVIQSTMGWGKCEYLGCYLGETTEIF